MKSFYPYIGSIFYTLFSLFTIIVIFFYSAHLSPIFSDVAYAICGIGFLGNIGYMIYMSIKNNR